ncbi:MAG: hypothetical protein AAFY60_21270, partial [Myxococcota bacterium]
MTWRLVLGLALLIGGSCSRAGSEVRGPDTVGDIQLDRTQLNFTLVAGQIVAAQEVLVTQNGGTVDTVAWTSRSSAPWLAVTPEQGTTPQTAFIRVDPNGLPLGSSTAQVEFFAETGSGESTRVVSVSTVQVTVEFTAPGWESTDGPYGGEVEAVASDGGESGRVLASTTRGELFLSDDGGRTYRRGAQICGDSGGRLRDLSLDATSGVAWAACSASGIFRSIDSGTSWEPTAFAGGAREVAAVSGEPAELFVRDESSQSLFYTMDSGANWQLLSTGDSSRALGTTLTDPDEVFYVRDFREGLRSVNRGSCFEDL